MIHVPELLREDVSVASSWFSSQGLYNDAWTNIHQIWMVCLQSCITPLITSECLIKFWPSG